MTDIEKVKKLFDELRTVHAKEKYTETHFFTNKKLNGRYILLNTNSDWYPYLYTHFAFYSNGKYRVVDYGE